ncbi:MAG: PilZ domain-containing protein [Myxococcota bacterium]
MQERKDKPKIDPVVDVDQTTISSRQDRAALNSLGTLEPTRAHLRVPKLRRSSSRWRWMVVGIDAIKSALRPSAIHFALPASDSKEQRQFARIPSVLPVHFQLLGPAKGDDSLVRTGLTQNLSEKGMSLHVSGLPESRMAQLRGDTQGVQLLLDIRIPGRTIRVAANVVRVTPCKENLDELIVGAHFVDLSAEDHEVLKVFSRRAARRPQIVRLTFFVLVSAVLLGSIGFAWHNAIQSESLTETARQLEETSREYDKLAFDLATQTEQLEKLSQEVRQVLGDEAAEDDELGEMRRRPEGLSAVTGLAADIRAMEQITVRMRRQIEAFKKQLDTLKKQQASKSSRSSRRKRRR